MIKNIILHVGTPKTGTTAIQSFLYLNSKLLEKQGIYYPLDITHEQGAHYPVNWAIEDESDSVVLSKLKKALESKTQCHTMLISSEMFTSPRFQSPLAVGKTINFLRSLGFNLPNIKIIVYFRPPDQYFESIYNERVKNHGVSLKLRESIAPLDYYYTLGLWAEKIGKNNIIVRLYDKGLFSEGNIFSDFCDSIGVDMKGQELFPEGDVNPKLSPNEVEMFRLLNSFSLDIDSRRVMNDYALEKVHGMIGAAPKNASLLAGQEKEEIIRLYEKINDKLCDEYQLDSDARELFKSTDRLQKESAVDYKAISHAMAKLIVELWKTRK